MPYSDNPESPEEIDPALLWPDVTVEVMMRDPSEERTEEDGTRTPVMPDPSWLTWKSVPAIHSPDNCRHGISVCEACIKDWNNNDWYVRILNLAGEVIWQSSDYPTDPTA